jgi:hypothetical protein
MIRLKKQPGCKTRKPLISPVFSGSWRFLWMPDSLAAFRHKIAWETA